MSADSLYDNIQSYLRLASRVVTKVGDQINVREQFTLRFTGSNTAYPANKVNQPRIVFLNSRIFVEGTAFATPVNGNGWHDLPDQTLFPGESSFVDIDFTAQQNIGGIADWFASEHVAKAWIQANLDQDRFFQIWNYSNIHQEIEPT